MSDFFTSFYQHCDSRDNYLELRAISSKLPIKRQFFALNGDYSKAFSWVDNYKDQYNIYFGIGLRDGKGGEKANVTCIPALYVDIDFKDVKKETAASKLWDWELKPSFVIESGGGYHAYWLLNEPIQQDEFHEAELILSALVDYIGADPQCKEIARVLRVPDTLNHKYNPQRDVKLIYADNSLLYDLSSFLDVDPIYSIYSNKESETSCPAVSDVNIGFEQNYRDQTVFHLANALSRSGMPKEEAELYCRFIGLNCNPPMTETEIGHKIKSAYKRRQTSMQILSTDVKNWALGSKGIFLVSDVYSCLQLVSRAEKKHVSKTLSRLCDDNIIERTGNRNGMFRRVDTNIEVMDFINAQEEVLDLWLPFGLHNMVETMPGNIILIAGEPNSGKTAWLMNVIKDNMRDFKIHYFNSEMGSSELGKRLKLFDMPLSDWTFEAYERADNFADVIKPGPGNINIIDYLEIHDEFWKVGQLIFDIHNKLKGAVAIIALQKRAHTNLGKGGISTLEKPRLALSMSPGQVTITKAKNWKTQDNPNNLVLDYSLYNGCKFKVLKDWRHHD